MPTTLASGSRLGTFEIVAPLGAGGMGEVYRAKDSRLGREVAIKVLPEELSRDPDRVQRFEQEARAASALNHPNILTVHDLGTHDGTLFLVAELLEGETLRERLAAGAMPPRKAAAIATQVARGLSAAHNRGIVHRDLKPENIFITVDGVVKILDFGLAKLMRSELTSTQLGRASTTVGTAPGIVLGTVGYMSPEQVRGLPADHRSDLFAFGATLYEMLCGRRAFQGDSAADTMSAILKEDPPNLAETGLTIPPALGSLVHHCLEKNPAERWQTAHDVALQLQGWSETGSTPTAALPLAPVRGLRGLAAGALALAALIGGFAGGWWTRARSEAAEAEPIAVRAAIPLPLGVDLAPVPGHLALSPDGRRLAFAGIDAQGAALLWVRRIDADTAEPLAGTERPTYPFWSPDGRFIAFFADGKLKKIAADGGPVQTLCDAPVARGGTWNRSGVILFAPNFGERLYRVPAGGGEVVAVTAANPERQYRSHRWPAFLPDGDHFLYFVRQGPGLRRQAAALAVGSLAKGEEKVLLRDVSNAVYSAGHLLFLRERNLMAQPFDLVRRRATGEPVPIATQLNYSKPFDVADFTATEGGMLAYRSDPLVRSQLRWLDRQGRELGAVDEPGYFVRPRLSPDRKTIAVVRLDPRADEGDVWLYDTTHNSARRFTFEPDWLGGLVWSPDSRYLAFGNGRQLFKKAVARGGGSGAASGSGSQQQPQEDVLLVSDTFLFPTDWSADGRFLIVQRIGQRTAWDVWAVPVDGDRAPFALVETPAIELGGSLSPDGRWLAYVSNESGRPEVYVRSFAGSEAPWRISQGGGASPHWRRDGGEITYVGYAAGRLGTFMSVEVKPGAALQFGQPRALFRAENLDDPVMLGFEMVPDGERFLLNVPTEQVGTSPIILVSNWRAASAR